MAKITDPDDLNVGTEITFDLGAKTFTLVEAGNLVAKDGVTVNAIWAKFVDLWTTSTYQPYPFPMNVFDARSGQYVFGQDPGGTYNGWKPANDTTRQMMRDGGWSEYSAAGVLNRQYVGMVALASGFPTGAQFYYQRSSGGSANNFTFDDSPNEGIQIYGDASNGNFDNRVFFKLFCREPSYTYDNKDLSAVGESGTGAYKVALPIAVSGDLDIQHSDAYVTAAISISSATWSGGTGTINTSAAHGLTTGDVAIISGVSPTGWNVRGVVTVTDSDTFTIPITSDPTAYSSGGTVSTIYSKINVKYFSGAFSKDVESSTDRNFGIVIDAGTHSGVDGSMTSSGNTLTSAAGGIVGADFTGGTLVVHEGTNAGTYTISGTPTSTTVTISTTFANTNSNGSFTLYPAVTLGATLQQIYTKIQYLLRQNSNINTIGSSVTGKTADLLLNFVGPSLKCGFYLPTNPNGGGSGVIVEGVSSAERNSIVFYDNTGTTREYPFVSAGTLNFNAVLTSGGTGYYKMFFTTLPGSDNDYGEASAVVVDDASAADIAGTISSSSISFTFDYSNNSQGGRTPGTDAAVTVVAGNPGSAKPVVATGTIDASKTISLTLTAEADRAYLA